MDLSEEMSFGRIAEPELENEIKTKCFIRSSNHDFTTTRVMI